MIAAAFPAQSIRTPPPATTQTTVAGLSIVQRVIKSSSGRSNGRALLSPSEFIPVILCKPQKRKMQSAEQLLVRGIFSINNGFLPNSSINESRYVTKLYPFTWADPLDSSTLHSCRIQGFWNRFEMLSGNMPSFLTTRSLRHLIFSDRCALKHP